MTEIKLDKPNVYYVLVGMPGVGKSTFYNSLRETYMMEGKPYMYVSSDYHVEQYAKEQGKKYSDVFKEYIATATAIMEQNIESAFRYGMDVIHDQTNLTPKKRARILKDIPDSYSKIALLFPMPNEETRADWEKRLNNPSRSKMGKIIPMTVLDKMIESYVEPTLEEGFEAIIEIDTFKDEKTEK